MKAIGTAALPRNIILALVILSQSVALGQGIPAPAVPDNLQISLADRRIVFDKAWEAVWKNYFDPKFSGVNWTLLKEKYRPLAEAATDKVQLVDVLQKMLNELHTSHMSVSGGFQRARSHPPNAAIAVNSRKWSLRRHGDCNSPSNGIQFWGTWSLHETH